MKKSLSIFYILILNLLFCSVALSCSYANNWWRTYPPCSRFNKSNIVALGTVKKIDISRVISENGAKSEETQIMQFEIQENFKGSAKKFIFLKSSYGMCSRSFKVGEKFIVFSSSVDDGSNIYQVNVDYSLKGEKDFESDIEYCRKAKKGIAGATISGVFVKSLREEIEDSVKFKEIVGANILIKGSKSSFKVKTDEDGRFYLSGLKADTYEIKTDIPNWLGENLSGEISIGEDGCEEVAGGTTDQSSIKGVLINPNGELMANTKLELVSLDMTTNELTDETLSLDTDENGQFEFYNVPEGKYLLAYNYEDVENEKYADSYYPDVTDFKSATVIEIKNRQDVNLGYFKLLAKPKKSSENSSF